MLLHTASQGAFVYFLFLFQNPYDLFVTTIWACALGLLITLVSSYYGYTASGGPVGVGRNTAWSMLINLVLVSITAMMFVQLFYGNDPNAPIGN
jgi:phospholipid/cholesterol/gamma-HCH transport system permease protein